MTRQELKKWSKEKMKGHMWKILGALLIVGLINGLSAEIERNLISERTKLGIANARKNGKQIGRRKGQIPRLKLDGRENEIIRLRKQNVSKSRCAILLNVSRITLLKYMRCKGIN